MRFLLCGIFQTDGRCVVVFSFADEGVLPAAEERARGDGVRGGEAGPALRRGLEPAQQAQQRPPGTSGGAREAGLRAPGPRPHPGPPSPVQVLPPRPLPARRPRGAPRQARARRRRRLRVPRREVTVASTMASQFALYD